MNTEARDPLLRALDDLAGMADQSPATDRMAGVSRRARANRRRKVGAGVAGLVLIAAGTVGVLQLLPGGDASGGADIADDPTPPPASSGLTIDLTADPLGPKALDVSYRIHGSAAAWSDPETRQPMDFSGPSYTAVKIDGEEVTGSDGGAIECRPDAALVPFDETWGGNGEPLRVPIAGPGTYTVTVEAPYCGPDGKIVPNEVSTTVTVR